MEATTRHTRTQDSGEEFFRKRYESLGGKLTHVPLKNAIRMNPLQTQEYILKQRLESLGVIVEKIPYCRNGFWTTGKFSLGSIAEHFLGYYYVQETASQLPVQVLNPEPGDLVLDACASPGGKTTQLQEWMGGKGCVVAIERKPHRMPQLLHNLERMRTPGVIVFQMDAANAARLNMHFDKILLDAPCSGNYAADKEWLLKRDITGIRTSAAIQRRILGETIKLLKPNGVLVYSTCSLEPEENELNMQWILERGGVVLEPTRLGIGDAGLTTVFGRKLHPTIKNCTRCWPHKTGTQGFFVARLRKAP